MFTQSNISVALVAAILIIVLYAIYYYSYGRGKPEDAAINLVISGIVGLVLGIIVVSSLLYFFTGGVPVHKIRISQSTTPQSTAPQSQPQSIILPQSAPKSIEPRKREADKHAKIVILNGTNRNGVAQEKTDILTKDGYLGITPSSAPQNWGNPSTSTVYYYDAELKETAEDIGKKLGIKDVVRDEKIDYPNDSDIAVLIR